MSCISPQERKVKTLYNGYKIIKIPCNHCLNCLIKRTNNIEFLAKRELVYNYTQGKSAAFVTLTYDDQHLPINNNGFVTLRRDHIQKFIKNMRRQMEYYKINISFKYLYCGEYGDGSHSTKSGQSTFRSHYHIIFIGLSPEEVKMYTRKLWKYGLCDIGPLSNGGLRYLCKYMLKSSTNKTVKIIRNVADVQSPFFYHSIGLGKSWIDNNLDIIVKNDFTFKIAGKRQLFPAYVINYVAYHTGVNPKPFIQKYFENEVLNQSYAVGKSFIDFDFENSFINEQYLAASFRSQGKPFDNLLHSRHWAKPVHFLDRDPNYLQDLFEDLE